MKERLYFDLKLDRATHLSNSTRGSKLILHFSRWSDFSSLASYVIHTVFDESKFILHFFPVRAYYPNIYSVQIREDFKYSMYFKNGQYWTKCNNLKWMKNCQKYNSSQSKNGHKGYRTKGLPSLFLKRSKASQLVEFVFESEVFTFHTQQNIKSTGWNFCWVSSTHHLTQK